MVELNDKGKIKKGITYRRWLKDRLHFGAGKLYDNEKDEYCFVGKFGSNCAIGGGCFDEHMLKQFTKAEYKIVVELAKEYGAFDY